MGHPTIFLPFLLLVLAAVTVNTVRVPSAIPFPHKDELEYLTSEEEERLIYGGDESVIISKIKDMPDGLLHPPNPRTLPVPTMDPPLPEGARGKRPSKSNRGFPFRIPRVFLKQGARLITPLNRKPRTRVGSEIPIPSYRSRPSSLVSSDPDQLEVAFKRIEIMASRAGLNMSAMPRRTQMQVLNRLVPKLPPKLAYLVKTEMKDPSNKMYQYLPEPMKDPLVEDTQTFLNSYIEDDAHLTDEFSDFSVQQSAVKKPDFDASKVSITVSDEDIIESHEQFGHLPSITTEKYDNDKGAPNFVLIPPSELHEGLHDYNSHKYEAQAHTHNLDRDPLYSRNVKETKAKAVSSQPDYFDSQSSDNLPSIVSSASKPAQPLRADKALKLDQLKTAKPTVRVSLPTKDRFVTIPQQKTKFHNLTEPIRVSIISKDRISINRSSDPVVKVIHIQPVKPAGEEEVKSEEIAAVVEEVKEEEKNPIAENEAHKQAQLTRVKLITKDVIKAEEDKYKLSQEKQRARTTTTTTTTVRTTARPVSKNASVPAPTMDPDIMLKLDMYDDNDWSENANYDDFWADQYDLTDEEIAATVAELKKYEEQSAIDNSLEQEYPWRLTPHPLEYPDHPDHPKDSPEEPKEKEKKPEAGGTPPANRPPPEFGGRRPGHGGHMRRPPMRRPPFRRPPPHRRPPMPRPPRPHLRVNEVKISEIPKEFSKECDYFSDDLCLVVQDYPIEAISEALEKHPDVASVLVKEPEVDRSWVDGVPRTQEHNYNFKHYFGQRRSEDEMSTHRHRDFAGEGGFLCPSKVAYGQVKKAKSSSTGEWKYVVNFGENTQTLRLEKCLSPGNTCSYVMPHYRTACTQVHNYHRLLAWDSEKGLHMDVFKIPTCCTCHVQGYYIPQAQGLGFSPRRPDLPPKLKFAPPSLRNPFARGAKKMPPPSLLKPVPGNNNPKKPPAVVVTDVSNKPNDKIKEHAISSSAKELKDDLHDLLAQYSALRERIAKKKNENLHVSYIANVSNSTDSLRPKTRESRNPTQVKKSLLQLKKLQLMKLKKMNITTKDGKLKKPFARARAMLLARLNRKLKSSRSGRGRAMRQEISRLGAASGNSKNGKGNGGVLSMETLKSRIQLLRTRLNKYNERNKMRQSSIEERLRDTKSRISNKVSSNSQPNTSNSKATSHRLRISPNRPSKVNYSYHPIMDYFNSKKQQ